MPPAGRLQWRATPAPTAVNGAFGEVWFLFERHNNGVMRRFHHRPVLRLRVRGKYPSGYPSMPTIPNSRRVSAVSGRRLCGSSHSNKRDRKLPYLFDEPVPVTTVQLRAQRITNDPRILIEARVKLRIVCPLRFLACIDRRAIRFVNSEHLPHRRCQKREVRRQRVEDASGHIAREGAAPHDVRPLSGRGGGRATFAQERLYGGRGPLQWRVMSRRRAAVETTTSAAETMAEAHPAPAAAGSSWSHRRCKSPRHRPGLWR